MVSILQIYYLYEYSKFLYATKQIYHKPFDIIKLITK